MVVGIKSGNLHLIGTVKYHGNVIVSKSCMVLASYSQPDLPEMDRVYRHLGQDLQHTALPHFESVLRKPYFIITLQLLLS